MVETMKKPSIETPLDRHELADRIARVCAARRVLRITEQRQLSRDRIIEAIIRETDGERAGELLEMLRAFLPDIPEIEASRRNVAHKQWLARATGDDHKYRGLCHVGVREVTYPTPEGQRGGRSYCASDGARLHVCTDEAIDPDHLGALYDVGTMAPVADPPRFPDVANAIRSGCTSRIEWIPASHAQIETDYGFSNAGELAAWLRDSPAEILPRVRVGFPGLDLWWVGRAQYLADAMWGMSGGARFGWDGDKESPLAIYSRPRARFALIMPTKSPGAR